MSKRIDHAAEAGICINYARGTEAPNEALLNMVQAQAHATLALVEQQRIANLLTYLSLPDEIGATPSDLWPEVNEVLGL